MTPEQTPLNNELENSLQWFIKLRWIGCAGLALIVLLANSVLHIPLFTPCIFKGITGLALCNVLYMLYLRRTRSRGILHRTADIFIHVQIFVDLAMLAMLLNFAGGIENPFTLFFIFHMVLAGILLPESHAYGIATGTMVVWTGLVLAEWAGILPHHHLSIYPVCLYRSGMVIAARLGVMGTTLFIAVYFTSTIMEKLRQKERQLAAANDLLAEQDRLKSKYVHTVSHDLRSSLATIQSCLKVVLDGTAGSVPEKILEMVGRAEKRTRFLLAFVKDLLNLSRLRAERSLETERADAAELLERICTQWQERAAEKNITLTLQNVPQGTWIKVNIGGIEQVVINLVENALRYTPWGGRVTVTASVPAGSGRVRVSVADSGIGIPEEDIPRIFEDFYRARNAMHMEKEGTGFGLSIVKQIITGHGGEIWVESTLGKGSTFAFTLPLMSGRDTEA